MTIVVTGASGFIGSHLVQALGKEDVRAVPHTPFDPAALADADVVFHLAGPYKGDPTLVRNAHVGFTGRVVAATPTTARLVYVSSTSVYGWSQAWPADEKSPIAPASFYGECKAVAESIVRTFGGPHVIVRPTIVYGPGDEHGMLPRTLSLLRRGIRVLPGDGRNRVHLLHIDDCVAALIRVGLGPQPVSDTYVLAGPYPTPIGDAIGWLAEGAGLNGPRWGLVPAGAARALARVSPLDLHSVEVATRDRCYSAALAGRELAWTPVVGPEDGLRRLGASASVGPPKAGPAKAGRAEAGRAEAGRAEAGPAKSAAAGFDWRAYFDDPDEGLGTVYERFGLDRIISDSAARVGATSVLHAPSFGMMGIPGLDAALQAQRGVRVGLAETDPERLEAVVGLWERLGLPVEPHLLPSVDPATWPAELGEGYDLVFSFAALWWFDDPDAVLRAQAGWARKSLVTSVPNKNIFMRLRSTFWHRRLFDELNEHALDTDHLAALAPSVGMHVVKTGLFDMPPFPDTSVPIARILRRSPPSGDSSGNSPANDDEQPWSWSILPYLEGSAPDLPDRIDRIGAFERHFPRLLAPAWAHHRYVVMERTQATSSQMR